MQPSLVRQQTLTSPVNSELELTVLSNVGKTSPDSFQFLVCRKLYQYWNDTSNATFKIQTLTVPLVSEVTVK